MGALGRLRSGRRCRISRSGRRKLISGRIAVDGGYSLDWYESRLSRMIRGQSKPCRLLDSDTYSCKGLCMLSRFFRNEPFSPLRCSAAVADVGEHTGIMAT